jgi:iron(III) transport system permease protein
MAVVVCLPMITPPFLVGLGLSQVFGQAGFVSLLLEATLGIARSRWFFGPYGLILAQVLVFFPIAYFLVLGALDSVGRTQIEAARFLGASDTDVLRSVTLPAVRDPLAVALLIVFVEALSDIGNPLVIGGKLRVLSTELFYSSSAELASGEMTGVPALLMVAIALGMAAVKERFSARSGRGRTEAFADEPGRCELPPIVRRGAGGLLVACVLVLAAIYGAIGIGAFSAGGVATGAFTLENFVRGFGISSSGGEISLTGSAWDSLIASLSCAFLVAPAGGAIGMAMVWILQRGGIACSPLVERISSYVLSVPSVVIGAGFLLAFGHLGLSTRGAWALILLAMLIRNLAVCMRFGGVALRRVDSSLSEISGLFGAGSLTTFSRVVAPMLHSTFVVCVAYGFVRSMTMLGSVLLLSSAENQVATTYMIDRVGIGEYGVSMAYGVVLATCIGGVLSLIWMFSSVRKNAPELRKAIGDLKAAVIHV